MCGVRVTIVDHPLLATSLATIRDHRTATPEFVEAVERASALLLMAATAELPTRSAAVTTPLASTPCEVLAGDVVLVPILRAGLGMLDAARQLLPQATVAFVGLRRDESTAQASWYLDALPESLAGAAIIVLEPMIATGGTLCDVVARLDALGAASITITALLCTPEGIGAISTVAAGCQADIHIVAAAKDEGLDANKFIVPGLGDAGDRLFGSPGRS